MASSYSFDVTTSVDLQEVDNAVNQAQKEVSQRFDFKGALATIEFKRAESTVQLAQVHAGVQPYEVLPVGIVARSRLRSFRPNDLL